MDTNVLKVNTTTNRVGINTAGPGEALEVIGNIKASGTLTSTGDLTVDTNVLKVDTTTNRVGVNIATPAEALDVVGNVKVTGNLSLTGNVLGAMKYSSVSGNSGSLQIVVPTDVNSTDIVLQVYGIGIASNSFFVFRVGTDSANILSTAIYDYTLTHLMTGVNTYAESGDSQTAIRVSNNLNNNEGIVGNIRFTKLPATQGATAAWLVEAMLRPTSGGVNMILLLTGRIRHTGGIGAIRFESASGNFNKVNSFVRVQECRYF